MLCMTWAAVGTALASPAILWALVPFAAVRAIPPGHPFDVVYINPESGLVLTVTVIADLVKKEFVLFIGHHRLAGVPDGDDALDGQALRETQEFGDILC